MTPNQVRSIKAELTLMNHLQYCVLIKPLLILLSDLGPLIPNWFEELTVKASRNVDIDVGESMVTRPSSLEDNASKPSGLKAENSLASRTSTPKFRQKSLQASQEFLAGGKDLSLLMKLVV